MSFLAPLFLLGGLALAAPVIFHLVRRTTRERTVFSSLMFLLPSPPRLSRRHRLEHILLLILRCAALALLAVGFARPFLRQTPADDPTAVLPKRIAILVDTSASMRRDGLWQAARERVAEVLRRTSPADQVALLPFDRQAGVLVSFEDWKRTAASDRVAFVLGRLAAIGPTWGGTHLGNALVTAAEFLAEDEGKSVPGPRQIVLVSDLQAGSRLDALQAYEWPKGVDLLLEPVKGRQPTNAGVQLIAEGPDAVRAVDAPVRVRVTNSPDATRERFKVGWVRAGGEGAGEYLAAPLDAYVPPGQSRVLAVAALKGASGAVQIALSGDDEAFDNTAHFVPPTQQRPTLLWIGTDVVEDARLPLYFLRRAFAETPRVAVRVIAVAPSAPLPAGDLAAASLVFVTDPVGAELAAALRGHLEAGRTVVFAPKKADAGLEATLGALMGGAPVPLRETRPSSYAMFAEIDFQHPLLASFADPRFSDFTKIRVWQYRKIDPSRLPGARAVARFDTGDPAWLECPVGRGRLHILAAGWHPEDSQLAVSSKFVPLMWSLLETSGGVDPFATQYTVGEDIALPAEATPGVVRGPAGLSAALEAGTGRFTQTTQPGLYEVTAGARSWKFAVNLDANESRTAPLGPDELEQLGVPVAKAAGAATVARQNRILEQGIEAENRQKLWRWLLAGTLAVLLAESALAGWTARRRALEPNEATS
jgi:hypothetical protein